MLDFFAPVFVTESKMVLDEEGEVVAPLSEMAMSTDLSRFKGKTRASWKFFLGNLKDPSSIPADHAGRHFFALKKKDPQFAQDVKDAGIGLSTRVRSHKDADADESEGGSYRVEQGEKGPVKVRDILHIRTLGHEQHAPLARALDTWAGHVEANGGNATHAQKLRYEAAKLRTHFGTGTDADAALVGAGRPGPRGSAASLDDVDLDIGGEAPAKAAEPAAKFDKKGKGKKVPPAASVDLAGDMKESADPVKGTAKAAWALVESRKAAAAEKPAEEAAKA